MTETTQAERPPGVGAAIGVFVLLLVATTVISVIGYLTAGINLASLLAEAAILVIALAVMKPFGLKIREVVGKPPDVPGRFWIWALIAALSVGLMANDLTGYLHQVVPRSAASTEALVELMVPKSWGDYLLRIACAAIMAGIAEEIAFRGFLQTVLTRNLGAVRGLILTTFLFAIMHLDPRMIPGVFLIGLILGYITLLARSLWISIIAHALLNALAFTAGMLWPESVQDMASTLPLPVTAAMLALAIIAVRSMRQAVCQRIASDMSSRQQNEF